VALGTRIVRITQELSKLYPGVLQIAEAAERFGTWERGEKERRSVKKKQRP